MPPDTAVSSGLALDSARPTTVGPRRPNPVPTLTHLTGRATADTSGNRAPGPDRVIVNSDLAVYYGA